MASRWGESWGPDPTNWGSSWDYVVSLFGGKSRWQKDQEVKLKQVNLPPADHLLRKAAQHMSSLGGLARAKALTSSARTAIATKAAQVRWKS